MAGSTLGGVSVTGGHTLRVSANPPDGMRVFTGVARHGGAVAGFGAAGIYKRGEYTVYLLNALTALVRIALQTQVGVNRVPQGEPLRGGPFELTVALPGATGALLDGFAPGWANIGQGFDDPPMCADIHPVVRLEIESIPADPQDVTPLLTSAMSRVVNLFGTDMPLYANMHNVTAGVPRDY